MRVMASDVAWWHAGLAVSFPCAGREVKVSVSSVTTDGEPRFDIAWSSRPARLSTADIAGFEAHKRVAIRTLLGRLAALGALDVSLLHDFDQLVAIIRHSSATNEQRDRWSGLIAREVKAERNRSSAVAASNAQRAQAERDALDAAVLQAVGVRSLDHRGALKVARHCLEAAVARDALSSTVASTDPDTCWPPDSTLRKSLQRIRSGECSPSVLAAHIQATQGAYTSVQSSVNHTTRGTTR